MAHKKQNPRSKAGARVVLAGGRESTENTCESESSTKRTAGDGKRTSTKAQVARLLELLRQRPHTTIELRRHAILMPAARIFDLKRDHGCTVLTELLAMYDDQGVRHQKCARYTLVRQQTTQAAFDFGVPA